MWRKLHIWTNICTYILSFWLIALLFGLINRPFICFFLLFSPASRQFFPSTSYIRSVFFFLKTPCVPYSAYQVQFNHHLTYNGNTCKNVQRSSSLCTPQHCQQRPPRFLLFLFLFCSSFFAHRYSNWFDISNELTFKLNVE